MNGVIRPRAALLSGTAVCVVVAVLMSSTAWAQDDQPAPTPGWSLKGVSDSVKTVFGTFDRSMQYSSAPQTGPLPGLKTAPPKITTCAFERTGAKEAMQVISNQFRNSQDASRAFQGMAKVRNAQGPFYTSDVQRGDVQMHQGPGRLTALAGNQIVVVHWMVSTADRRAQPKDVPGETLSPIAVTALRQ